MVPVDFFEATLPSVAMTPEEIKALRHELGCTAKELSAALGVELTAVSAWERGELFPTKRLVGLLAELRAKGPAGVPRTRRKNAPLSPMQALAAPDFWRLVRKLAAHPELRTAALALAERYPDPADE